MRGYQRGMGLSEVRVSCGTQRGTNSLCLDLQKTSDHRGATHMGNNVIIQPLPSGQPKSWSFIGKVVHSFLEVTGTRITGSASKGSDPLQSP